MDTPKLRTTVNIPRMLRSKYFSWPTVRLLQGQTPFLMQECPCDVMDGCFIGHQLSYFSWKHPSIQPSKLHQTPACGVTQQTQFIQWRSEMVLSHLIYSYCKSFRDSSFVIGVPRGGSASSIPFEHLARVTYCMTPSLLENLISTRGIVLFQDCQKPSWNLKVKTLELAQLNRGRNSRVLAYRTRFSPVTDTLFRSWSESKMANK